MNFDFSDDQRRLQDELRRMFGDVSPSSEVRTVLAGQASHSARTWQQLASLGALGVAIPEDLGGSGLGHLELCLVAEEAGRALAAVPLLPSIYLAAEAIRRGGSAAQQQAWLPRLADGSLIATAVLDRRRQHAGGGAGLTVSGEQISGTLPAVPDALIAALMVLRVDDRLWLVDLSHDGVTRMAQAGIDPTRPLGQLQFDRVPAEPLAQGDAALADQIVAGAAVLLAFEQVGGAERALHAARDYSLERRAFGRVIGGFQAVKHKLAEIYTAIELARAHAWYGAWALSTGAAELPRAAAAARCAATDAYTLAAEESLHLHGGIGFTWEMDCHLHLRRARWLGQIIGTRQLWTERLASALIEEFA